MLSSRKHKKHRLPSAKICPTTAANSVANIVADKFTLNQNHFHFLSPRTQPKHFHFLFSPRHLNFASREYTCVCWMNEQELQSRSFPRMAEKVQRKCNGGAKIIPHQEANTNTNTNTNAKVQKCKNYSQKNSHQEAYRNRAAVLCQM